MIIGTLIRISEEELRLTGSDSIPLESGGYAAGLGVGHNLHCVVRTPPPLQSSSRGVLTGNRSRSRSSYIVNTSTPTWTTTGKTLNISNPMQVSDQFLKSLTVRPTCY